MCSIAWRWKWFLRQILKTLIICLFFQKKILYLLDALWQGPSISLRRVITYLKPVFLVVSPKILGTMYGEIQVNFHANKTFPGEYHISTRIHFLYFMNHVVFSDWQFVTPIKKKLPLMSHIAGLLIILADQLIFTVTQITECSVLVSLFTFGKLYQLFVYISFLRLLERKSQILFNHIWSTGCFHQIQMLGLPKGWFE